MKPIVALLVIAAACRAPVAIAPPLPRPTSAPAPISEEIVVQTNVERRALNLPALARNAQLMQAAQIQADQMAAGDVFEHQIPGATYPNLTARLNAVGYPWATAAENIAEGYSAAVPLVSGWMKSPGHRANIVSTNFTEMGAGAATSRSGKRYHVQVFGRQK